jgi:hypothetical protein
MTLLRKVNWDVVGAATSLACAIHCALLPLILSSLPLFGINIINNLSFELFMILLAFAIGAYSLYHGWKKHHRRWLPFIVFTMGMVLLFCKQLWHNYQLDFLIPAVVLIISAHYLNFRYCRACNRGSKESCNHEL